MKKDFSHIFEHDYQGFDNFCQEVLQPMFGNRIELMSCSEDFIATTGKKEQADAANILSIRKVAEINLQNTKITSTRFMSLTSPCATTAALRRTV